ncbi:hypothetical protein LVX13_31050 [Streptomyces albulus]|uniref:hypothetical protein n=1 Tax=Streptomyces noursei TaxID=1971 RepID=UPI001F2E199D|nr:hypothetical protein [Streptomyces noursei]MCE4947514.1 hypothetical protein [Streptomyces noursei]
MFLNPKPPEAPPVPATAVVLPPQPAQPVTHMPTQAPCACQHASAPAPVVSQPPAPRRPIAPFAATGAGAVLAVVAVGVVLTALLTAVAVGAVSVAVCAVVLRSLLTNANHRR